VANYIVVHYFIRRLQTVSFYLQGGYLLPGVCLSCCMSVCLLATSRQTCWSDL